MLISTWPRTAGKARKAGTRKGKKIIIDYNYYLKKKKIKGCSQKYRNKKGVTSGSGNNLILGKLGAIKKGTRTSDKKTFTINEKIRI